MKFCKVLETQDSTFPELHGFFLRYKALKKRIKAIPAPAHIQVHEHAAAESKQGLGLSPEEKQFVAALDEDLDRLNAFFIEKEEGAVIQMHAMSDALAAATTHDQLHAIKGDLVNFHGELVMILHWSLINYSAIVKILKKHDKCTGVLLRAPYLANVLQQPFSSTNVMTRLVKRAEELVETVQGRCDSVREGKTVSADSRAGPAAGHAQRLAAMLGAAPGGSDVTSDDEGSSITGAPHAVAALPAAATGAFGDAAAQAGPSASGRIRGGGEAMSAAAPVGTHQQGAAALRAQSVLQMWASLAETASTPSTVLSTAAGAVARHASQLPPSRTGSAVAVAMAVAVAGAEVGGDAKRPRCS
ncbi:hypothetical protein FOA52_013745 [Chlamydomonas sp. UWO 241]|nr:hypothetical protein FOA52_013745 [Chlamydomonas sp. UWO 241]